MGQIASFLGAGFLGGMVGGYIVGYIALFIRKHLKVPHWAEALMPMMIIPTLSSIIAGLLMYFVIGTPIVMVNRRSDKLHHRVWIRAPRFCTALSSVPLDVWTSAVRSARFRILFATGYCWKEFWSRKQSRCLQPWFRHLESPYPLLSLNSSKTHLYID